MLPNTLEELIAVTGDSKFEVRIAAVRSDASPGPTLSVQFELAFFRLGPPRADVGTRTLRFTQVELTPIPAGQSIMRNFTESSIAHRWQYEFVAGQMEYQLMAGERAVLSP